MTYYQKTLAYKWYRFLWWFAGTFHIPIMVHIDIETSSECNLHCTFCPHDSGFKNKGIMPFKRAVRAIEDAMLNKVKSIKFNFRGEPGLNKDLERLSAIAYPHFTEVFMNTNGIPFTEDRIKNLMLDKVKISIDGATKKVYNSIRKGSDTKRWEKLNRNLKAFKEYHNVEIQMTTTKNNIKEVDKFKQKFKDIPIIINKERQKLSERKHCPQPYRRMIVAHDGAVYGCCNSWFDQFPIGDFKNESLREIWKGNRMKELRRHAKHYTGPCKDCDIREAWK